MLLAELGFLNIFLGGGFRVQIAEGARMSPIIYYFSDVPEWAALLANIRNWWRSYPWMAWYPGVGFFLAILAFNVAGEGLRRLMDDARVNVGRLFNRYTLGIALVLVAGLPWVLRTNTPVEVYRAAAGPVQRRERPGRHPRPGRPGLPGQGDGHPRRQGRRRVHRPPHGRGGPAARRRQQHLPHVLPLPARPPERSPVAERAGRSRASRLAPWSTASDFVEYIFPTAPTFGANQGAGGGPGPGRRPGDGTRDAYGLAKLDVREKVLIVHSPRAEW